MGLKKVERRKEQVPLYTNEDQDRLVRLGDALEDATTSAGPSRLNDTPVQDAAREYDEFMSGALERAEHVAITALRGRAWRQMLLEHPPRKDVLDGEGEIVETFEQDQKYGFNVDTIARPLVVASVDLDQFDDQADRDEWVDDLDDPKFSRIYSAAVRINTIGGPDPNFNASSWIDLRSAVMSRLGDPSEEASASSSDSQQRTGDSSEQSG